MKPIEIVVIWIMASLLTGVVWSGIFIARNFIVKTKGWGK